jgi:hypothetical protein
VGRVVLVTNPIHNTWIFMDLLVLVQTCDEMVLEMAPSYMPAFAMATDPIRSGIWVPAAMSTAPTDTFSRYGT